MRKKKKQKLSAAAAGLLYLERKCASTPLSHQETRIYEARKQGPKPQGTGDAKKRFQSGCGA